MKKTIKALTPPLKNLKKQIGEIDGKDADDKKERCRRLASLVLAEILFLYKSEEYSTEHEYRTIRVCHDDKADTVRLDEGRRPSGVRYKYVTIGAEGGSGPRCFPFATGGAEIIVGPKVEDGYGLAQEILFRLKKLGGNATGASSSIDYR